MADALISAIEVTNSLHEFDTISKSKREGLAREVARTTATIGEFETLIRTARPEIENLRATYDQVETEKTASARNYRDVVTEIHVVKVEMGKLAKDSDGQLEGTDSIINEVTQIQTDAGKLLDERQIAKKRNDESRVEIEADIKKTETERIHDDQSFNNQVNDLNQAVAMTGAELAALAKTNELVSDELGRKMAEIGQRSASLDILAAEFAEIEAKMDEEERSELAVTNRLQQVEDELCNLIGGLKADEVERKSTAEKLAAAIELSKSQAEVRMATVKEIAEIEARVADLMEKTAETNSIIAMLRKDIAIVEAVTEKLAVEREVEARNFVAAESEIASIGEKQAKFEAENKAELAGLASEILSAEAFLAALKAEIEKLAGEKSSLAEVSAAKVADFEAKIADFEAAIAEVKSRRLDTADISANPAVGELELAIDNLQKQVEILDGESSAAAKRAKDEADAADGELREERQRLKNLNLRGEKLDSELSRVTIELAAVDKVKSTGNKSKKDGVESVSAVFKEKKARSYDAKHERHAPSVGLGKQNDVPFNVLFGDADPSVLLKGKKAKNQKDSKCKMPASPVYKTAVSTSKSKVERKSRPFGIDRENTLEIPFNVLFGDKKPEELFVGKNAKQKKVSDAKTFDLSAYKSPIFQAKQIPDLVGSNKRNDCKKSGKSSDDEWEPPAKASKKSKSSHTPKSVRFVASGEKATPVSGSKKFFKTKTPSSRPKRRLLAPVNAGIFDDPV